MMRDEVYSRAQRLAGELEAEEENRLEGLCDAVFSSLEARLREGMSPEDCREPFLTAVSLQAVATLEDFGELIEFKAGDMTMKRVRDENRIRDMRYQADMLMAPYLKDRFLFRGV